MLERLPIITPKGKYSIAAAALGFLSFLLPWVAITLSNGAASVTKGESPATLLSLFMTAPQPTATTDPAILAWEQMAQAGLGIWTVGAVTFLLGCLVTLGQTVESYRWGGLWMILAVLISTVGIHAFSTRFTTAQGYTASIGPGWGIGLAVVASLIALVPAFKVDEQDEWVRCPSGFGWTRQPTGEPLRADLPPSTPLASPAPGVESPPQGSEAGGASAALVARRFCPDCGSWFLDGQRFCPRDGAPLRPVRESAT